MLIELSEVKKGTDTSTPLTEKEIDEMTHTTRHATISKMVSGHGAGEVVQEQVVVVESHLEVSSRMLKSIEDHLFGKIGWVFDVWYWLKVENEGIVSVWLAEGIMVPSTFENGSEVENKLVFDCVVFSD